MNHPKLLPSQELVLHQVSIDNFSPAAASVLKFPTSPLLPRSPFSPSPSSTASSPSLTSSLNPPTSTAASSIVRPQIRLRAEWETSLGDVDAFQLSPNSLHTSSFDRRDTVRVRYIADRYDRAWLSRRPVLSLRGEDGGVSVLRGKTGGVGSYVPVESHLSMSVLEDVFTALELAAYYHPEVPLERLLPYAKSQLDEGTLSAEVLDELHAYWLLRRNGAGGLLSTVPNLRATIREDNEMALCHPAVLRDCPLPFKHRDWYVPIVERRRPDTFSRSAAEKRPRSHSPAKEARVGFPFEQLGACIAYVEKAQRLSRAMLEREETRLAHTHLTLYELAYLRSLASAESTVPTTVCEHASIPEQTLARFLAAASGCVRNEAVSD
ncbi:hypothetical protein ABB37_01036 [Leptomonas pyrrhocoris]|uniref:Uncharacterized protein n=1 Tax=Leptomonas pyrrhocoris TaxID=157538 RepID=A0A0N0VGX8_LEPPY|nr:hypothetical protein ABB37_01036 [Leptomonas pyrrhocoris]XP_015662921.1 hypothetical protein ABB37_01036 [Leptomonas pyrrhocoris]KPA84481.1 hypothetical protein ABB37_01036 [Leptomonas pyrrhocoris]KPA84482.1 hypothetical protein ABB37_01036 [Leptomonas pyrrhocoris]|eukprot:XP_015662920.1 hypothetical protein ABB37_01036 [Leptomonas pyrrhocoris]